MFELQTLKIQARRQIPSLLLHIYEAAGGSYPGVMSVMSKPEHNLSSRTGTKVSELPNSSLLEQQQLGIKI